MASDGQSQQPQVPITVTDLTEQLIEVILAKTVQVALNLEECQAYAIYVTLTSVSRDWHRIVKESLSSPYGMDWLPGIQQPSAQAADYDTVDGVNHGRVVTSPTSAAGEVIDYIYDLTHVDFDVVDGGGNWADDAEAEYQELVLDAESHGCTEPGPDAEKVLHVVHEIIDTERRYLKRLHLINKDFREQFEVLNEQRCLVPKPLTVTIFSNIDSIYRLHLHLLRQLKMPSKVSECNVGRVFCDIAPYFKLYATYVVNSEPTTRLLGRLTKNADFGRLVEDFRNKPECMRTHISDVMQEPNKRLPRFTLLLREYLKRLPAEHLDRDYATRALDVICKATRHANSYFDEQDAAKRLIEIARQVDFVSNITDLVRPGRRLIREFDSIDIVYLSKKERFTSPRALYLFSDLMMLCQAGSYVVTDQLEVIGMKIHDVSTVSSFAIRIKASKATIELQFSSADDKNSCYMVLKQVVEEHAIARHSLLRSQTALLQSVAYNRDELGLVAPEWISTDNVQLCAVCGTEFTLVMRRRHRCLACGSIVCRVCSRGRVTLPFTGHRRPCRVCDNCHVILYHKAKRGLNSKRQPSGSSIMENGDSVPPLHDSLLARDNRPLCIDANIGVMFIHCGNLSFSRNRDKWTTRWFALHKNAILFAFNDSQDSSAVSAMLLYNYEFCTSSAMNGKERKPNEIGGIFALRHRQHKTTFFFTNASDDAEDFVRWNETLADVVEQSVDDVSKVLPYDGTSVGEWLKDVVLSS